MKQALIRLAALSLVFALSVGFVGCSNNGGDTSASSSTSQSGSTSTSGSTTELVDIPYSKGLNEQGLWDGITMSDFVTLGEYKDLTVPADEVTPTEEELEAQRQSLVQSFGEQTKITDRAVEDGDIVNIDYVGSVDGVEFSGGNSQGAGSRVTAGSQEFIDDFLTQIIGHMPGETIDVVVTFPDDYQDSTDAEGNTMVLAGKEAVFKTTINYIYGDMVYPEFNDEFVSKNLSETYGWNTVEEANSEMSKSMMDYSKYQYLVDHLLETCTVSEIPQSMLDILLEQEEANLTNVAVSNGMDVNTMLSFYGYESLDAFREDFAENAGDQIKLQMIYQMIAEQENLLGTEDQLKEQLGTSFDTAMETYGSPYMYRQMLLSNVTNFLMDNNTVG